MYYYTHRTQSPYSAIPVTTINCCWKKTLLKDESKQLFKSICFDIGVDPSYYDIIKIIHRYSGKRNYYKFDFMNPLVPEDESRYIELLECIEKQEKQLNLCDYS